MFPNFSLGRRNRFGPKIVKIGAILEIFWPFEVGGANFYWSQFFRDVVILCGVLANMSVNEEARQLLVEDGIFKSILQCMQLEPHNIVLQIACIKALVT